LYEKYEQLLTKNNKTSYQVSKDTNIAQSVLSGWKTGRSTPKIDKLQILSDYFNVPITYFLEEPSKVEK
jgi:repressor LexA